MAAKLAVPQLPLKFNASPASLLAAAEERKQQSIQAVNKMLAQVSPSNATFTNSILPLIEAENEWILNDPPISFYAQASPSEDIRNASH
jgi:metallopeptidase MepB